MEKVPVNYADRFAEFVLRKLKAPCIGCNLRVLADTSNWEGPTLQLPSGENYTFLEYDGGEGGVQQVALCKFHSLSVDTLCKKCADLHGQLRNFSPP